MAMKRLTSVERERIKRLWHETDLSAALIAERFGIDRRSVTKLAASQGWPRRNPGRPYSKSVDIAKGLGLATVATLISIAIGLLAEQARAHGDASWIQQNPAYKRYQYPQQHCCGPEHCGVAPAGKFIDAPGGVMDTATQRIYLRSHGTGVYVSKDENWWWCWTYQWSGVGVGGKEPTCIFKPSSGF